MGEDFFIGAARTFERSSFRWVKIFRSASPNGTRGFPGHAAIREIMQYSNLSSPPRVTPNSSLNRKGIPSGFYLWISSTAFLTIFIKFIVRTTDGVISIIPILSQITLGVFPGIDFHHFPLSFGRILSIPSLILIISHI